MVQHTIWKILTGRRIPFQTSLLIGLWFAVMGQALPADVTQTPNMAMQQQIQTQGLLLLSNLQQARKMGLRGDPWAMAYALDEARRMLDQIAFVERMLHNKSLSPHGEKVALRPPEKSQVSPLYERLVIDVPLSVGRRRRLADLDQSAGFIPLPALRHALAQATKALNAHPPELGAALIATDRALAHIDWQPGLKAVGWSQIRDLVLQGYALALDSHPGVKDRLAHAHRLLTTISGGSPYTRRLDTLIRAPSLDIGGLRTLVEDLDGKVQLLRNHAERIRLEHDAVELRP